MEDKKCPVLDNWQASDSAAARSTTELVETETVVSVSYSYCVICTYQAMEKLSNASAQRGQTRLVLASHRLTDGSGKKFGPVLKAALSRVAGRVWLG
jgi:hypothetical protein